MIDMMRQLKELACLNLVLDEGVESGLAVHRLIVLAGTVPEIEL